MKRIERSALVPYSATDMFALVNDVEKYPQFMPGCKATEVLQKDAHSLTARLHLAKAGLEQSLVTRNLLYPPERMTLELVEGPFSSLHGEWKFTALSENACKVSFWLEFEFKNKFLSFAAGKVFELVASEQVKALCDRANALYK